MELKDCIGELREQLLERQRNPDSLDCQNHHYDHLSKRNVLEASVVGFNIFIIYVSLVNN